MTNRITQLVHLTCWTWSRCDFVSLPSNKDAATVLLSCNSADPTQAHNKEDLIEVGRYYIMLITEWKMNTWYIASCERKNPDGTYEMDHLTRVQRRSDQRSSSQRELIRSIYKQNPLLNVVLMMNGIHHRKGIWLLPYRIMFIFQIWLKQCSPDSLNYFYIITQFWHFFAPFFIFWMMPYSLLTN